MENSKRFLFIHLDECIRRDIRTQATELAESLFKVYFTIPQALQEEFGEDVVVLTEQVQKVLGLETLDKGPDVGEQKFMGTSRSYLQSKLDSTSNELIITITLDLREGVDNYIYKLLRAWNRLGYNTSTGETTPKKNYVADWFKVVKANRAGDIFKEVIYKDVMLIEGLSGFNELDYNSNDRVDLEFKLKSIPHDWRVGQFMYNYYFDKYPEIVNRVVQERPYVDCFYNDNKIDDFLTAVHRERCSKL